METLQFVCLKWGNKYPADYVNCLYGMLLRTTSKPFSLFCMTEDEQGLHPEIKILPLTDTHLKAWWNKLCLFKPTFYHLEGSVLFLDLDVVITDDLSPLFDYRPGEFVIIRDRGARAEKETLYNSSVFRLDIGKHAYVWERFEAASQDIIAQLHGDQDWISQQINNAVLWPDEWVVSYKKQCNARIRPSYGKLGKILRAHGWCLPKDVARIPEGAKVIQFHGKPDPEDVMDKPYGLYKSAPWIKHYRQVEKDNHR